MFKLLDRGGGVASSSIVVRRQGERAILYRGEEAGAGVGPTQGGEDGEGEDIEKENVQDT